VCVWVWCACLCDALCGVTTTITAIKLAGTDPSQWFHYVAFTVVPAARQRNNILYTSKFVFTWKWRWCLYTCQIEFTQCAGANFACLVSFCCTQTVWLTPWSTVFVVKNTSRVQISARRLAILTQVVRGFPQPVQSNAGIKPIIRTRRFPSTSFPIYPLPIALSFVARVFLVTEALDNRHKYIIIIIIIVIIINCFMESRDTNG
jgi:hypothetical protein